MKYLVTLSLLLLATYSYSFDLDRPADNSTDVTTTISLWAEYQAGTAYTYVFEVSEKSDFSTLAAVDTNNRYYGLVTGLKLNTKYYWRSKRWKGTDTTSSNAVWSFTTSAVPTIQGPRQDAQIRLVTPIYLHKCHLKNYEVWLDTTSDFSSSALRIHRDVDSTDDLEIFWRPKYYFDQDHYLKFRAYGNGDTTPWSDTVKFNVTSEIWKITRDNDRYSSVSIEWLNSGSMDSIRVQLQFDTTEDYNSSNLIQVAGLGNDFSSFKDIDLFYSKKYFFRARALHALDTGAWNSFPAFNAGLGNNRIDNLAYYPNQDISVRIDTFIDTLFYKLDTTVYLNSPYLLDTFFVNTTSDNQLLKLLERRELFYGKTYYSQVGFKNSKGLYWAPLQSRTLGYHGSYSNPFNNKEHLPGTELMADTSWLWGNYIRYQVDTTPHFDSHLLYDTVTRQGSMKRPVPPLDFGKTYYWRIQNAHAQDTSFWSNLFSTRFFKTVSKPKLNRPSDRSRPYATEVEFSWDEYEGCSYELQADTSPDFSSDVLITRNLNTTKDTLKDLYFASTYYWRVRLVYDTFKSAWSDVRTLETPSQIFGFSPKHKDSSVYPFALDWSSIIGTDGYIFRIDTQDDLSTKRTYSVLKDRPFFHAFSEFNDELLFDTRYWHQLGLFNGVDTLWGDTIWFHTRVRNGVKLTSPADESTDVFVGRRLEWQSWSNVKGYRVRYSLNPDMSDSTEVYFAGTNTFYNFTKQPNTTYYWQVRAMFNEIVVLSDWSFIWSFTTGESLDAPTLISPDDGAVDVPLNIKFQWSQVPDAVNYTIWVSDRANFSSRFSRTTVAREHVFGDLKNNTLYYWRVRASAGGVDSEWSEVRTFTTESDNSSVSELEHQGIYVSPNPFASAIEVQGLEKVEEIHFVNALGQELEIPKQGNSFETSHLADGVYFVLLSVEGKTYRLKLVKGL
jgi:hypothetical protein